MKVAIRSDVNRTSRGGIAVGLCLAAVLGARAAHAEPAEGFIQPAATVQSRIFNLTGKNEIGVFGAFSLNNVLTQSEGISATYDYNFNEFISLEVLLGGSFGGLTDLAGNLRLETTNDQAFSHNTTTTDLSNAGALLGYGQVGARLTPLYGKVNLASELPVHFDLYLNLGVGAAFVQYNSILGCNETPSGSPASCPNNDFHKETLPTFAFNAGVGLRLFITQMISIRVEIRDLLFPDHYYRNLNLSMPVGTYTSSNLYPYPGITSVPLAFVGVGFLL